ncbi:MAG: HEAT repeat domain-containing protein [Elusimicrobiales bacterium]|nr:HEAT repeat domain-containing protein [Elusimicrobiales bacterium]
MINHIEAAMAELLQKKHRLAYVRSRATDKIIVQIKSTFSGVFLIEGLPGIGKSASLQPVSDAVGAHNPERVISYYFSSTDPVLNNADNFYEYACAKVKAITAGFGANIGPLEKGRKDHIDFQQTLFELGEFIGNDVERRVYFFIDGLEELRDPKEFLGKLPYVEGVVYVIFSQPGVCDAGLPDRFYEKGKIKNRAEIKFLGREHAEAFFWEAYGKDIDNAPTKFEETVSGHLVRYLEAETNRYPLLLKVLAEDAREDGYNPDRAWAGGLEEYLDTRVSSLSENARRLLVLVALSFGPLQKEDLSELLGDISLAACEAALKEARRFLVFKGQGIVISHAVWGKLISKRWADKSSREAYLNWCADWRKSGLRYSKAHYIAANYIFHIIRDAANRQIALKDMPANEFAQFVAKTSGQAGLDECWRGLMLVAGTMLENKLAATTDAREIDGVTRQFIRYYVSVLNNDPDPEIRAAAAKALGAIGDPCVRESLVRAVNDKFEEVRVAAQAALERLKS